MVGDINKEQLKDYKYRWFYGIESMDIKTQMEITNAWSDFMQHLYKTNKHDYENNNREQG